MPGTIDPRDLWFDVSGLTPDVWREQRSAPWGRIERIQGAFQAGRTEESEEQFQRDWEAQQRKDQQQETSRKAQESIEKLKAGR